MDHSADGVEVKNGETEKPKENIFRKLCTFRHYFIIEPLLFFYFMPKLFTNFAMTNMMLNKACLINLGFSELICSTMLEKDELEIDCDAFTFGGDSKDTGNFSAMANAALESIDFNYTVCLADLESQKPIANLNAIRGPMASIVPLIVILFAGGWSDRHKIRKPCMIFALVGDLLGSAGILLSAIFLKTIPLEATGFFETVVPSLFGGQVLFFAIMYSYISDTIKEEDRAFRLGILATFINIIILIGIPFGSLLTTHLGYVEIFGIAFSFSIVGMLYILFFINDVKWNSSEEIGQENPGFELSETTDISSPIPISPTAHVPRKKCLIADLFDPTLVRNCLQVFTKKRPDHKRTILILFVMAQFFISGAASGEGDYTFLATKTMLGWDGNGVQFSYYNTYSTILSTCATFFVPAILTKIFKISDSMVGLIAATSMAISRFIFAFAKTTWVYYLGGVFEMLISVRVVTIHSITPTLVQPEEMGGLFAVDGVAGTLGGLLIAPTFSLVYKHTVDTFTGAFFLYAEVFYIPVIIIFGLSYIIIKKVKGRQSEENGVNDEKAVDNAGYAESTHL